MWCVKCGEVVDEQSSGALSCRRGLEFSLHVSAWLREHYPGARSASTRPAEPGETWFCPGCRAPLDPEHLDCSACGISLRSQRFAIVELHPHPDGRGGYF